MLEADKKLGIAHIEVEPGGYQSIHGGGGNVTPPLPRSDSGTPPQTRFAVHVWSLVPPFCSQFRYGERSKGFPSAP